MAEKLAAALPVKLPTGTLAITLHRDDYDRRGIARNANNGHPAAHATRMPTDITDRHVLLVDDVIASGRTGPAGRFGGRFICFSGPSC